MSELLNYQSAGKLIITIGISFIILLVFFKPIIKLLKFSLRGAGFSGLIYVFNIITVPFGFSLGLNVFSSLCCAFLGLYGFLGLYIVKLVYML